MVYITVEKIILDQAAVIIAHLCIARRHFGSEIGIIKCPNAFSGLQTRHI